MCVRDKVNKNNNVSNDIERDINAKLVGRAWIARKYRNRANNSQRALAQNSQWVIWEANLWYWVLQVRKKEVG